MARAARVPKPPAQILRFPCGCPVVSSSERCPHVDPAFPHRTTVEELIRWAQPTVIE